DEPGVADDAAPDVDPLVGFQPDDATVRSGRTTVVAHIPCVLAVPVQGDDPGRSFTLLHPGVDELAERAFHGWSRGRCIPGYSGMQRSQGTQGLVDALLGRL